MAEQVFLQLFKSVDEQMSHLTTTMGAQGIAKVVQNFDGSNPKKFKDWVKSIEKFATLTGIQDEKIKLIAYQASRGPVSDYMKRYMDEHPTFDWNRIKVDLKSSFGEAVDSQHALLLLRKVKQKSQETVHVYAERLLALGEDAFEGQANDANPTDSRCVRESSQRQSALSKKTTARTKIYLVMCVQNCI